MEICGQDNTNVNVMLNDAAIDLYLWAKDKGIVDESVEWIIETVLDQEIVSFSTSQGTVSFDIHDIEWEG